MPSLAGRLDHDPALLASLVGGDPLAAALALARLGVHVFPVHAVGDDLVCTCGAEDCPDAGKHPRTPHGHLDATTDPSVIANWMRRWPGANPGAATGAASGIWVLDVDPRAGGEGAFAALEAGHGQIPPTWAAETGGGGLHLWFAHPGAAVPTTAGKLGPGLDVRGDGAYVVCPPARHRSGGRYAWGAAWRPGLVPLAAAPEWLLALARRGKEMVPPVAPPIGGGGEGNHFAGPIPEGRRNATLASLAGSMRRRGFGEAAVLAALLAENAARCAPPLPEAEVAKVARSVARYAPAPDLGTRAPVRGGGSVEFVGGKAVVR